MNQKQFRTLSMAALLALGTAATAQPVLTNNVFPGFVQALSTVSASDSNAVSEGSEGANITWNFSVLTPAEGTNTVVSFLLPGGTPYAASFPTSNLAGVFEEEGEPAYTYLQHTNNELLYLGLGIDGYLLQYTNPQTLLKVPLAFGDDYNDSFQGTVDIDGFILSESGESETVYDAYGTLIMPNSTFNNAIRLKTVTQTRDTTDLGGGVLSITTFVSLTYNWYAGNHPGPIVTIDYSNGNYTTIIPGFPPQIEEIPLSKQISYSPAGSTAVADVPELDGIGLSFAGANPAADQLSLNIDSETSGRALQLQIFDLNGNLLASQNLTTSGNRQQMDIPVGFYPAGQYFVSLTDGQARQSKGWVKI